MIRTIAFAAVLMLALCVAGVTAGQQIKTFEGRVILVMDNYVEIKKGRSEYPFFWDEKAEVYQAGVKKNAR